MNLGGLIKIITNFELPNEISSRQHPSQKYFHIAQVVRSGASGIDSLVAAPRSYISSHSHYLGSTFTIL